MKNNWKWYGHAGHLIVGHDCRFHLCTLIGEYLISTVGEYWPDSDVREILAKSRGITLEGRGDAREADARRKLGYIEIGCDRKYETMVFKVTGEVCKSKDCNRGMPRIIPDELDSNGYNDAGAATKGRHEMCAKWSASSPAKS